MDPQHIETDGQMSPVTMARIGARYLSQIQEESDSREQSSCFLPPIVQQQQTGETRKAGVVERQEVRRLSEPALLPQYNHQERLEDSRSLLDELARIEKELRESLHLDEERRREAEFLRQEQNKLLWENFCYLSLSQRIAKPWVSSYFKKFPMHIYCLPVQGPNHKGRRRGLKRRR